MATSHTSPPTMKTFNVVYIALLGASAAVAQQGPTSVEGTYPPPNVSLDQRRNKIHMPTQFDGFSIAMTLVTAASSTSTTPFPTSTSIMATPSSNATSRSPRLKQSFDSWLASLPHTLSPISHDSAAPSIASFGLPTYTGIESECHPKDEAGQLYFTLVRPNGTLVSDTNTAPAPYQPRPPLFYISTSWRLTYDNTLYTAILNDATKSPTCPTGHCHSTPIPHTANLRLTRVRDPMDIRVLAGAFGDCGYLSRKSVTHAGVTLGTVGDFMYGMRMDAVVLEHFVSRMEGTYPKLEMGLFLGLLVLPGIFLACAVTCYLTRSRRWVRLRRVGQGGETWWARGRGLRRRRRESARSPRDNWNVNGGFGPIQLYTVRSVPPFYKQAVEGRA